MNIARHIANTDHPVVGVVVIDIKAIVVVGCIFLPENPVVVRSRHCIPRQRYLLKSTCGACQIWLAQRVRWVLICDVDGYSLCHAMVVPIRGTGSQCQSLCRANIGCIILKTAKDINGLGRVPVTCREGQGTGCEDEFV